MQVAMIGLGKLGLPVSCAMVQKGHTVYGYDVDRELTEKLQSGHCDFYEPDIENVLQECLISTLRIVDTLEDAVEPAEIIFIAVPTPSLSNGAFDNSIVSGCVRDVTEILVGLRDYKVIAIISTVLPGSVRGEFYPILREALGYPLSPPFGLCYNAQFIAMGTVIDNMLNPEFVLVGEYDRKSGDVLGAFYSSLTDAPILRMSIENAEIVKVCYNTYIGFKIIIANAIMEICDKTPFANCDVVSNALSLAKDRLISARYMQGGLGDGGPCHPRDARALSYLAYQVGLSTDPFAYLTEGRIMQSRYLVNLILRDFHSTKLPVAVLGLTFKPETNLTVDSPALLLVEQLDRECKRILSGFATRTYDPIIKPDMPPNEPHIYVLAMRHEQLRDFPFVPGSIIIDPWRMLDDVPEGCVLRRVGVG